MSSTGTGPKRWKTKLLDKYRIVIVNDRTFEDVKSFKLNILNVWMGVTTLVFVMILSTVLLLVLTPVKEYIPGYSSSDLKQKTIQLTLKVDSLEAEARRNSLFIHGITQVLKGDVEITSGSIDSLMITANPSQTLEHKAPSENDKKLRELVHLEDKYNLFPEATPKVSEVLFSPVDAEVVKKFDPASSSYGLDFILTGTTPIKSIAKGTVLLSQWNIKDGYMIAVLHKDGIVSVYKHLTSLIKDEYDIVESGEVLGLFDVQEHDVIDVNNNNISFFNFELWKDSFPLDPSLFIDLD
ncbi:M23 family metallopeptidase [Myroides sp. LJL115]